MSLAAEILKREQDELVIGRGTVADVAEAAQRLDQFKLDLITRHLGRHHHRAAVAESPWLASGR